MSSSHRIPESKSHSQSNPVSSSDTKTITKLIIKTKNQAAFLDRLIQNLHDQNQAEADYIGGVQEQVQVIKDRSVVQSPGFMVKGMLAYLLPAMAILRDVNDQQLVRVTRMQFEIEGLRAVIARVLEQ